MKRLLYYLMLLLLASCKKEMMGYEGMEGVYFAVQSGQYYEDPKTWAYHSYTDVPFVKYASSVKELTVNIRVRITGPLKDYDRPFRVEINPDTTTAQEGVHYLPVGETFIIPANAIEGYIPVTVKRTPELTTQNKKLGLRLVANEHFGLAFPEFRPEAVTALSSNSLGADTLFDATLHTININDLMVQPNVWRGSIVLGTKRETGLWGAFTRKKLELMCQLLNITYADFDSDATMTLVLSNLIASEMTRYLVNQYNAGTPVKEEDGRLMWCGTVPWTSIIGVPYP